MILSIVWTGLIAISAVCAALTGNAQALAGAAAQGAQNGVTLSISIAGSLCLWTGVGRLMEAGGITAMLSALLRPFLSRLFPKSREDPVLAGVLSANVCANLLGLGNAATPMGLQAAKRMVDPCKPHTATDDLCRLIVLNTASIQLIPTTIAAVRASLGCAAPFDILPAIWLTSLCSAAAGLCGAWCLGKLRPL